MEAVAEEEEVDLEVVVVEVHEAALEGEEAVDAEEEEADSENQLLPLERFKTAGDLE